MHIKTNNPFERLTFNIVSQIMMDDLVADGRYGSKKKGDKTWI